MVSGVASRLVVLGCGTLYPAYRSYKAVRHKDVREYVKWMMYWIVFSLFICIETLSDILLGCWLPFYHWLKILFVIWLISPYTKGASLLYRKFIHPTLSKHEEDIDLMLDQAKAGSYNTFLQLGSKGILAAREIIATAAIKGQEHLVHQLRNSYSLNDLRDTQEMERQHQHQRQNIRIEELPDEEEEENRSSHSDGDQVDGGAAEERVWEGYYDQDGEPMEEEITLEDRDSGLRRSQRQRKLPADGASNDESMTVPRTNRQRRKTRY